MQLVERYLQAIGQYLPVETRADILAELRTELEDQMEARAEEWGRPLDEADVAALLKAHGRPEAVALRYMPQRSLIGPSLFPFYLFTLKRALPFVLVVWVVAHGVTILFSPDEGNIAGQIWGAVFGLVPTLFFFWGAVTIVFAVLDYVRTRPAARQHMEQWDPLKLPALKPQAVKQRSFSIRVLELVVHCLWVLYVLAIPAHPFLILGPGATLMRALGVGFGPVWHTFFLLLLVMLGVQLVIRVLALRDGEQALIKSLEFVVHGLSLAGLSLLGFAQQIFMATSPGVDAQKLASVNHAIEFALRLGLLFGAVGLLSEIWKYLRGRIDVRQQLTV